MHITEQEKDELDHAREISDLLVELTGKVPEEAKPPEKVGTFTIRILNVGISYDPY